MLLCRSYKGTPPSGFFFFKQETAYEITVRDWSSDVCSSDLGDVRVRDHLDRGVVELATAVPLAAVASVHLDDAEAEPTVAAAADAVIAADLGDEDSQER